jgi:hypothetical protein
MQSIRYRTLIPKILIQQTSRQTHLGHFDLVVVNNLDVLDNFRMRAYPACKL